MRYLNNFINIFDNTVYISSLNNELVGTVHIGNNDYPYIKIGNLYWLAQDLREYIGVENTDYFIPNPNDLEHYGIHYVINSFSSYGTLTQLAQDFLATVPSGWRCPTIAELASLASIANSIGEKTLLVTGSNELNFSSYLSGYHVFGNLMKYDNSAVLSSFVATTNNNCITSLQYLSTPLATIYTEIQMYPTLAFACRLVKDIT